MPGPSRSRRLRPQQKAAQAALAAREGTKRRDDLSGTAKRMLDAMGDKALHDMAQPATVRRRSLRTLRGR